MIQQKDLWQELMQIHTYQYHYNCTLCKQKLDGTNIKVFNIQWLRQQIGLVSQEPALFDMTFAKNIRYGANFKEVTDEEIQQAAKAADIHDFIMSLPQVGMDSCLYNYCLLNSSIKICMCSSSLTVITFAFTPILFISTKVAVLAVQLAGQLILLVQLHAT